MAQKQLHPTVERFKSYVKKNPSVLKEVRSGKKSMQQLYEEWYLLEDDEQDVRDQKSDSSETTTENKQDWINQVMGTVKNMDVNQVQGYITNMSQALGAIQGVLSQFQGGATTSKSSTKSNSIAQKPNPFAFKKD
ncbi:YlbD family protein [Cytobacillus sp. FSL R7-0696]|uniref:YlbD family protein n=1 Tax=Cytobacillus sp. FSL R7-0696 TaxID=2921691 RepID=UPI0030F98CDF